MSLADNPRIISTGPLSVLAIIIITGLVIVLIPLFIFGLIGAAFTRLGFSWIAAIAAVVLMLVGSTVNIPVWRIRRPMVRIPHEENFAAGNDLTGTAPGLWETIILVNLGGAVTPAILSVYLLLKAVGITGPSVMLHATLGTALVAAVTYPVSRTMAGPGIRVPLPIPALVALLVALFVSGGTGPAAAVTAFVGGTMGTILGGNIAFLPGIRDLDIREMSIGGAGTFGTVFLCCILPALVS